MVEHYDTDDEVHERPSFQEDAAAIAVTTLSRRFNSSGVKSSASNAIATPRFGATVCDTVYERYDGMSAELETAPENTVELIRNAKKTVQEKRKLIIILVGLPGRGKTYLCNKLMRYLNWLGHVTRHFNVGSYRRHLAGGGIEQDARFFDHSNAEGMKHRKAALELALDHVVTWLSESKRHQVAIFDATNSTEERRRYLISKFHGRYQYLFIESICNDEETLRRNAELKLKYSPDYAHMDRDKAMHDFLARIQEYEKVYEPLTGKDGHQNRHIHFIQLNNMVTGRGYMDINRISGYIPGKIVFFLMQVCRSGLSADRRIWLTRHGESEFNRKGLIGGDAPLTDKGKKYANTLARALCTLVPMPEDDEDPVLPVSCWTSTLVRTIQTARNVPFPKLRWKALDEIQAGICDGYTYEQIKEKWPETYAARKADKLNFRYPAGESYVDVVKRLEPIIIEAERESESVCIVGHQAILRVLYGYFMQVDLEKMPELKMPLHTLIELEPRPDGTMVERRYKLNIDAVSDSELFESVQEMASPTSPGSNQHDAGMFTPRAPVVLNGAPRAPGASKSKSRVPRAASAAAVETAESAAEVMRSGSGAAADVEDDERRDAYNPPSSNGIFRKIAATKASDGKHARFADCVLEQDINSSLDRVALSASLRQCSVASCASEWVDLRAQLLKKDDGEGS